MTDAPLYLLDQLETADMLEIDGLHAWQFSLNEDLLDQTDAAAEADHPFASGETVLTIEALDGRDRRTWRFSYNQVMEAEYRAEEDVWMLDEGKHRVKCLSAVSADDEPE
ncbi:hypothetical protein BZL41_06355 [Pseudomonas sp. PIC25]|uniref:DUF5629 family protein n=1 Tax=Pseudomonas sp. PIC25 TaxID=1958773 RepID=UPI000BABB610|nr:DUF5629 family protein [Pseudomonas sp. PIC25]PAU65477.1 hypothetical protein BZL41_06355 [Pseudomonas sp. PIC25]